MKSFDPVVLEASLRGKPPRLSLTCAGDPSSRVGLSVAETRNLLTASHEFYRLFDASNSSGHHRVQELATDLLAEIWPKLERRLVAPRETCLSISTDRSDLHHLPWELATAPDGSHLALDTTLGIERRHPTSSAAPPLPTTDEPWRILLLAASPEDLPELDLEREQGVLDTLSNRLGGSLHFETSELATWEAFEDQLAKLAPSIVHLSGHGTLEEDGGYFYFEDSEGRSDPLPVSRLSRSLREAGVWLVFVSACDSARAMASGSIRGICSGLVAAGIPYALGWAGKVDDGLAVHFTQTLYQALSDRGSIHRALVEARRSLLSYSQTTGLPTWAQPVLYTCLEHHPILPPPAPRRSRLPGLPGGRLHGALVGRRREVQALTTHLLQVENRSAVVNGLHGMGKSALVASVVPDLGERLGLRPLTIEASEDRRLDPPRIARELARVARKLGFEKLAESLLEDLDLEQSLEVIRRALQDLPLLLVLDSLEGFEIEPTGDDEKPNPRRWTFLLELLYNRQGCSKIILVGLLQPFSSMPEGTLYITLRELPERAALRLLLSQEAIAERVDGGLLPPYLLVWLVRLVGGVPGLLHELREDLANLGADALEGELARLLPTDVDFSDLPALRLPATDLESGVLESRLTNFRLASRLDQLLDLLDESSIACLAMISTFRVPVSLQGLQMIALEGRAPLSDKLLDWRSVGCITISNRAGVEYFSLPTPVTNLLRTFVDSKTARDLHERAALFHSMAGMKNPPWERNSDWLEEEAWEDDLASLREQTPFESHLAKGWPEHFEEALHHLHARGGEDEPFGDVDFMAFWLASRQLDLGAVDLAEQTLVRAAGRQPRGTTLDVLAGVYERKQDHRRALEVYRRMVALDDNQLDRYDLRRAKFLRLDSERKILVATREELTADVYEASLRDLAAQARYHRLDHVEIQVLELLEQLKISVKERESLRNRVAAIQSSDEQHTLRKEIHASVHQMLSREQASLEAHRFLANAPVEEAPGDEEADAYESHRLKVSKLELAALTLLATDDIAGAGRLLQQALDLARAANLVDPTISILQKLAEVDLESNRPAAAFQRLGEALSLAHGAGLQTQCHELRFDMGTVELARGRLEEARELFAQSAQRCLESGHHPLATQSLKELVNTELCLGNMAEAERVSHELIALSAQLDRPTQARARGTLTDVLLAMDRLADAEVQAMEWLALGLESQDPYNAVVPLVRLGGIVQDRGRIEEARIHLIEARQRLEWLERRDEIYARTLLALAGNEAASGHFEAARELFCTCRDLAEELGTLDLRAEAAQEQALLEQNEGDPSGTVELLLNESLEANLALDQFEEAAHSCLALAQVRIGRKQTEGVATALDHASAYLGRLPEMPPQADLVIALCRARLDLLQGSPRACLARLRSAWELSLDNDELEKLQFEILETFADLASAIAADAALLFFLALRAACVFDRERDLAAEPLSDLYETAEALGMEEEQADAILESSARQYFHDGAAEAVRDLCDDLEEHLDSRDSEPP